VILAVAIAVWIVFKCRKKPTGAYAVDESKNYAPLPTGEEVVAHPSRIAPMIPIQNGSSAKKKDFKEWYV